MSALHTVPSESLAPTIEGKEVVQDRRFMVGSD